MCVAPSYIQGLLGVATELSRQSLPELGPNGPFPGPFPVFSEG